MSQQSPQRRPNTALARFRYPASSCRRSSGPTWRGVGAANRVVADSQQMIEALRCHMRCDMTARTAGNTRRFEGVAIEDRDAVFMALPASSTGLPGFPWPSRNRAAARESVPCARPRHTTRRQPVPQPDAVPVSAWWLYERPWAGTAQVMLALGARGKHATNPNTMKIGIGDQWIDETKLALGWFKEILGPEKWDERRAGVINYFNDLIE